MLIISRRNVQALQLHVIILKAGSQEEYRVFPTTAPHTAKSAHDSLGHEVTQSPLVGRLVRMHDESLEELRDLASQVQAANEELRALQERKRMRDAAR